MRFGIYCEIQTPPGKPHYDMIWEIMRQIEHADESGFDVYSVIDHHFFQKFVFSDVAANMSFDLVVGKQQAQAEIINAYVIGDGGKVLDVLAQQRPDQVFRDAAQPKAAKHDRRPIGDVFYGFIGIGDYFVHPFQFNHKFENLHFNQVFQVGIRRLTAEDAEERREE